MIIKVIVKERNWSTGIALKAQNAEELLRILEAAADGGNEVAEIPLLEMFKEPEKEEEDEEDGR